MKSKQKTIFVCQNCGAQRPRWEGRCPECGSWNSLIEETQTNVQIKNRSWLPNQQSSRPIPIDQASTDLTNDRHLVGIPEFDRVLGGGVVRGSLILLGGAPGIGKSTLLLQVADHLASKLAPVLYISGEESPSQTAQRAQRLKIRSNQILLLNESNLEMISHWIKETAPQLVILDSIQTTFDPSLPGAPGTVSQVRECTAQLLNIAKSSNVTIILVGHVTKEGNIAGPKVLEHMVDVVLYLEGEEQHTFRLLRSFKNRFGPANELGIFQMTELGLGEVDNPSDLFLEHNQNAKPGSTVFCSLEGTRPLLCEIQALTVRSFFPAPRRTTVGLDLQRLYMLLAVAERHLKISFSDHDVYVSVVGGLNLREPAADLAVTISLISALQQRPTLAKLCAIGEIGLTGEVRPVPKLEQRIKEMIKLGFKHLALPHRMQESVIEKYGQSLTFHPLDHISQLKSFLMKGYSETFDPPSP
ncbi:MAG: DNA repair protein RadA [Pseudobdellovibrionaceae bacterium]|nr:DNA repair protein RadA [Pseudobdellovibrionaceae bacterium]